MLIFYIKTVNYFQNKGVKIDEKKFIFLRRYWFFDNIGEIAKKAEVSESKVKTTLHRLRNELKIYLQEEGYVL